jgi:hypothetical protein
LLDDATLWRWFVIFMLGTEILQCRAEDRWLITVEHAPQQQTVLTINQARGKPENHQASDEHACGEYVKSDARRAGALLDPPKHVGADEAGKVADRVDERNARSGRDAT